MHLRGKDMDIRLVYPTGESETLVSVPHYDFSWQTGLLRAKPIEVPKGTTHRAQRALGQFRQQQIQSRSERRPSAGAIRPGTR